VFFQERRAWPWSSMERQQWKNTKFKETIVRNVKEKVLVFDKRGLLETAGIAAVVAGRTERNRGEGSFGIEEGGETPCFVYRWKKPLLLDHFPFSIFFYLLLFPLFW